MKMRIAVTICAVFGMAAPSYAQMYRPGEHLSQYAQVKGWVVYAVTRDQVGFAGCRAQKDEGGNPLAVEMIEGYWQIVVPTNQTARFGGAILAIDKYDFDAQFGFEGGLATKELTHSELAHIKSGNRVGVEINGDYPRYWSLRGSTAAISKIYECANNVGQVPQAAAPPAPAAPTSNSISANCDSPTSGPYQCTVTQEVPGQGYSESYRIDSNHNQAPSFLFQVRAADDVDAWVAFDRGPWKFVGAWMQTGPKGDCSQPRANQSAEAWDTLGQDAWELCVYPH